MFGNLWNRLGSIELPDRVQLAAGLAAWFVLAGVPVGIIALYFLKLRRRPVQVPSTLLWRQSLEDLHVNSLFQRLRRNLLLFLQLLAVALAMLALAGPRMQGDRRPGAAVRADDRQLGEHVGDRRRAQPAGQGQGGGQEGRRDDGRRRPGDGDRVRRLGPGRLELHGRPPACCPADRLDRADPVDHVAARRRSRWPPGWPIRPSRSARACVASSVVTPKLFIYTDGGFADVEGFSLGNLEPEVVVIGPPPRPYSPPPTAEAPAPTDGKAKVRNPSDNVAILALQARRDEDKPDVYQLFGRVHNFRAEEVATEAQLYRHAADKPGDAGQLVDAIALRFRPRATSRSSSTCPTPGWPPYEVRLTVKDALEVDNRAFAVVGTTRKAQVLAITAGNRYLVDTLKTPSAAEHADVTDRHARGGQGRGRRRATSRAAGTTWSSTTGSSPKRPPRPMRSISASLPPGPAYAKPKEVEQPVILDWDIAHPMMQYIRDLSLVFIAKANVVELPPGAKSLIDSNQGPLAFIVPREGYHRRGRHVPADRRHDAEHDLVSLHQLSALHPQQHPGAGQRPRGERRRGGPARPARGPPCRDAQQGRSRSTRPTGRPAETVPALAPGDVRLQPRGQDRHLPGPLGAQAACCRSPSTCSTSARATWPRAAWSPRASPTSQAEVVQDQDRLQPRHRHPEAAGRPEGHLVVLRPAGPRRAAGRVVYL